MTPEIKFEHNPDEPEESKLIETLADRWMKAATPTSGLPPVPRLTLMLTEGDAMNVVMQLWRGWDAMAAYVTTSRAADGHAPREWHRYGAVRNAAVALKVESMDELMQTPEHKAFRSVLRTAHDEVMSQRIAVTVPESLPADDKEFLSALTTATTLAQTMYVTASMTLRQFVSYMKDSTRKLNEARRAGEPQAMDPFAGAVDFVVGVASNPLQAVALELVRHGLAYSAEVAGEGKAAPALATVTIDDLFMMADRSRATPDVLARSADELLAGMASKGSAPPSAEAAATDIIKRVMH